MPGVFSRHKLHSQYKTMLSSGPDRPAHHEITSARIMQARRRRKTPNRIVGHPTIDVLNRIFTGDKLKVCIARSLGGIGDVLMTTPVCKAIKSRYPNSEITYATDPGYANGALMAVLQNNPYIDHVIEFRAIRRDQYHLFADLTSVGLAREKMHLPAINRIDMFAEFIGIDLVDPVPTYVPTHKEQVWAREMISKWSNNKAIVPIAVHISSIDTRRNWPPDRFIQLIGQLVDKHSDLFFIIFDSHKKCAWSIKNTHVANGYGIRQTAALIDACQLFVGPDSGLLHIAGALDKDIVSLFGSTPPEARINHYHNAVAVTADFHCKFCWYQQCNKNFGCMTFIKVSQVIEAIENKVLSSKTLNTPLNKGIILRDSFSMPQISELLTSNLLDDALRITAATCILGEPKNYMQKVNDISLEIVDCNEPRKRKYPRTIGMAYVSRLAPTLSDTSSAQLNSFKKLFVGSSFAKKHLIKQNVTTPIFIVPLSSSIEPIPNTAKMHRQAGILRFATVIDTSELTNLEELVEAFTAAYGRDPDKRLFVLVPRSYIKEAEASTDDIRISFVPFVGKADFDKVLSECDVFIDSDPLPSASVYTLKALSRGVVVMGKEIDGESVNVFPSSIQFPIESINTEYGVVFDIEELTQSLELYGTAANVVDEDGPLLMEYIRDYHSKRKSAHALMKVILEG